ncbi:MAG: hypothetical protein AB8F34_11070 [Akkermansiaceae bacterium]
MKSLTTFLAFCITLFSVDAVERVYRFETGEDATSTHYEFVYTGELAVSRVRMLWNGGAQNKPTVTEYILNGNTVRITKMTGDRKLIKELIEGKEPKMDILSSYSLVTGRSPGMLMPVKGKKTLTEGQRVDLANLIWVLAKDRTKRAELKSPAASKGKIIPQAKTHSQ